MADPLVPPLILDLEASGFGSGSYPIEVGVAFPDGSTQCMLVRPEPEWTHWEAGAEAVHGISRQTLFERGLPARACCERLNQLLAGQTAYSDGWGHDSSWLYQLFDAAGMWPRFKLESLRRLLSESQVAHWQQARRQAMEELSLERHRASSDALIIQRAWSIAVASAGALSRAS